MTASPFPESDNYLAEARRATPLGSQTASKAPGRAGPLGSYPMFAKFGRGAYLHDIDGRSYLDFIAALAAIGLGYAEQRIAYAVSDAVMNGGILSLPTKLEADVADMFCTFIDRPWAQQVRWLKTGSEACEAAVRIARCATGRSRVVTVSTGYHGWHSWFQAVKPQHPGVPEQYAEVIDGISYGTPPDHINFGTVAAVILEPAPVGGGGTAEFLNALVQAAHAGGALVIFDEMVWGFRLAARGGSEYFGVDPDLACYGKALGNGVPIACVVGRAGLMAHAAVVSGTFGGDMLGLAAAQQVLRIYADGSPVSSMWARGEELVDGLRALGYGPYVSGYPVHPVIRFAPGDPTESALRMSVFLQTLADHGVLWHPAGGNIMACMTAQDIGMALEKMNHAFETALGPDPGDNRALRKLLRGEPYEQAFARAT